MHPRLPRALKSAAIAVSGGSLLFAAACSSGAGEVTGSSAAEADGGLSIVTSTSIWSDVARAVVAEDQANITSIIRDRNADPHSFEPSAADMARVEEADIIIVGGGGYDAWLYDAVDAEDVTLIHALPLVAGHDHDDGAHAGHDHDDVEGNEHIWYDTEAVLDVAERIADAVTGQDPDATVDTTDLTGRLDAVHRALHDLPAVRVAQTEPVAEYIVAHTPMTDVTPSGYRDSALSHSEPTAGDLAAFLELIDAGELDLLVVNPQTATDLTDRLRSTAEDAGITVIEIRETPPEGENFIDYFESLVEDLNRATANE